jgi:serine/threonine protein kinase
MDLIGKIIGHYKIIKRLGSEEVAELYEGLESRRGYPVLIKAVPFLVGDDPVLLRRFQQIARRIAALKSPHILSWRDVGQEGGTFYIITEMVRASPLFKKLHKPLDLETAMRLIHQVGEALQYAHEQDLLHGDLSPQKVLITEDDQVLVTDLGLSSLLEIAQTRFKHHASAYAAPEVRAGRSPDRRSDIYSLGAILYALLTGRAPAMTTPVPPSRFNPAIPSALEEIILKSLSSNPADRYRSVADMVMELSPASLDLTVSDEEHLFEEAETRQEERPEKVEQVEREEREERGEKREEGIPLPEIAPMPSLDMETVWSSLSEQIGIQQADISWEVPAISIVEPPPMPGLDIEAVWRSLAAQVSLPSVERVLSLSLPVPPPMPTVDWKPTSAGIVAPEIIVAPPPPPERKAPPPPSAPPSPPRPRPARPVGREEKVQRKAPVSAPSKRQQVIPEAEAPARPRSIWRTIAILFFSVIGIAILAFCGCCGFFSFFSGQATPSKPKITKAAVPIMTPQPTEPLIEVVVPAVTPTRGAAPQASPAPTEAPLFADDFSQANSGWAKELEDDYEVGYFEGEYRILVKKKNTTAWSTSDQSFTDFLLSVDARQAGGSNNNAYGLIYRYQDSDNFYYFRVNGNGFYSAAKMVDGKWKTLVGWKKSPHVKGGQSTNHLKLVCRGRYMSFYVNGEHLAEWWDSTFTEGDIGLAAGTYDKAGVLIYFDNLEVYAY